MKPEPLPEKLHQDDPTFSNKEVEEALLKYCEFPHPQGFAVMLRGDWGCGKTYFIKSFEERLRGSRLEEKTKGPLYVSLYGVSNSGDIADQLFQQLHPILSHKGTRLVGAVLKSVAQATIRIDVEKTLQLSGVLPELDIYSMLSGSTKRVIIFDDFERANMEPSTILGYINPLVEHDECKVIIVADESRIKDQEDYRRRKEKTIGKTYTLRPDPEGVFDSFIDDVDHGDAKDYLRKMKSIILGIFRDSKYNNLRSLKQFLWDFELLYGCLSKDQRESEKALQELLELVCAASFELRSGGLTEKTFRLQNTKHYLQMSNDNRSEEAVDADIVFKKYPTRPFESTLLNASTIQMLILSSQVSASKIQEELNQHAFYADRKSAPSWMRLWQAGESVATERANIVTAFEADFKNRAFKDLVSINHALDLGIWLSDLDFPGWDKTQLSLKLSNYVDDRYVGAATPDEISENHLSFPNMSGSGLGFYNAEDERFTSIREYHLRVRSAYIQRGYPEIASSLLQLVKEDGEALLRKVCFTNAGPSTYAKLGVLAHIDHEAFSKALLGATYADQKNVFLALSMRYDQAHVEPELEGEISWAESVSLDLSSLVDTLDSIGRFHFKLQKQHYLDKRLNEVTKRIADRDNVSRG